MHFRGCIEFWIGSGYPILPEIDHISDWSQVGWMLFFFCHGFLLNIGSFVLGSRCPDIKESCEFFFFILKKTIYFNIKECVRIFLYKRDKIDMRYNCALFVEDCIKIWKIFLLLRISVGFGLKCVQFLSSFQLTNVFVQFGSSFGLNLSRSLGFGSGTTRSVQDSRAVSHQGQERGVEGGGNNNFFLD